MSRAALALAAGLALSVVVNVSLMVRVAGMKAELDDLKRRPREAAVESGQEGARLARIEAELSELRRDLRSFVPPAGTPDRAGGGSPAVPEETAPARPPATPVEGALADADAFAAAWGDLKKLARTAGEGDAEYRRLAVERTAAYLRVDARALAAAADQMIAETSAANEEYQRAWRELWPKLQKDGAAHQTEADTLNGRRDAALDAARARVLALLSPATDRRHKVFGAKLDAWASMLNYPEFAEDE